MTNPQPPSFDQAVLLGIQDLLRRSYHLAYEADAIQRENGLEWFPLADLPEMSSIPAWREGRGVRDSKGEYHLPARTMAALVGMPLEHFEHRLQTELGIDITPMGGGSDA